MKTTCDTDENNTDYALESTLRSAILKFSTDTKAV